MVLENNTENLVYLKEPEAKKNPKILKNKSEVESENERKVKVVKIYLTRN